MPRSRRELGVKAEDRAASYLLDLGYSLITRRYVVQGGEIDIVALDGEVLVFVEVKSRRDALPEESLTPRKSSRLRVAAKAYLHAIGSPDHPHRFDLVAVTPEGIRHHSAVLFEDKSPRASGATDEEWSFDVAAG